MSSGLFSIANTALLTQQSVMQTISQNIANAQTPGYSRQEAVLQENDAERFPYGSVGTGVRVQTIIRRRAVVLDDAYRTAAGTNGETQMRSDLLGRLQGIFGEPSDAGMANALDQFWGAWSDLATSPSSGPVRAVVRQRGQQLAQMFNDYDTQISQLRTSSLAQLDSSVGQLNSLASTVAELNGRILAAESGSGPANDLRDQRDRLVDQMATFGGIQAIEQSNGQVTVLMGGTTMVDGTTARALTASIVTPVVAPATPLRDAPVVLRFAGASLAVTPTGGELKALMTTLNTDLPDMRSKLDAMASALAEQVNTVHRTGYTFSGSTVPGTAAGNFFDPGTLTNPVNAATLRLDASIKADANKIASSGDPNGPSDSAVAQSLSALRTTEGTVSYTDATGTTDTGSFVGFFRNAMTNLGFTVQFAQDTAKASTALQSQADARRQATSGVNTDEELIQMMKAQQAYTAAAKMIKVVDEMTATLLQLV